jgi:hypothetical protein
LQAAGYTIGSELAIPGRLVTSPDGEEIDLLFGDHAWLDDALRRPEQDAAGYPVLGLP